MFEARNASRMLGEQRGTHRDGATFFSVRLPIMGSGFHGRDYPGTPISTVWSGPSACLTLYMPVPAGLPLSLLVWIQCYAAQRQREELRVRVDGLPAEHGFASAEGCADLLTVKAVPSRDFVRLDIEMAEALTSAEAGREGHADPRKRGILFNGYGWKLSPGKNLQMTGSARTSRQQQPLPPAQDHLLHHQFPSRSDIVLP